MDGARYEPARIVTQLRNRIYGAAPKVEMPLGAKVSFINPNMPWAAGWGAGERL